MASKTAETIIRNLFAEAQININGSQPWDIRVNSPKFYRRVLAGGALAFGEAYMDEWWDCQAIDDMTCRVLLADLPSKIKKSFKLVWHQLRARIVNLQSINRAFDIGKSHYDIGNDLFRHMLDSRMNYSCAYWKNAKNLDSAQEAKLDLICQKLQLKEGMHVLDIGCGWGSFAKFAAEKYGVKVTGITVSKEQQRLAKHLCEGLDIDIELMDYRNLNETYDAIVSIGMFEHVGYKNYETYFKVVDRCLKPGGLFLLHSIGTSVSSKSTDRWIDKYIFPNSQLPSARQITQTSQGIFQLEDWHNFGHYYDRTLMAWHRNFNTNWESLKEKYGARFYRMWNYYLLSSAGSFRSGKNRLWQIVLSKSGAMQTYESIR